MKRFSPYNLTPLSSGWSWKERSLEIAFQTAGIALRPVAWLHKTVNRIAAKLFK